MVRNFLEQPNEEPFGTCYCSTLKWRSQGSFGPFRGSGLSMSVATEWCLTGFARPAILVKQSRSRMVTDCFSFYLFFSSEHGAVRVAAGDISLTIEPATEVSRR